MLFESRAVGAFVTAAFAGELLNALVNSGTLDRQTAVDLVEHMAKATADFEAPCELRDQFASYFTEAATLLREGRE